VAQLFERELPKVGLAIGVKS